MQCIVKNDGQRASGKPIGLVYNRVKIALRRAQITEKKKGKKRNKGHGKRDQRRHRNYGLIIGVTKTKTKNPDKHSQKQSNDGLKQCVIDTRSSWAINLP